MLIIEAAEKLFTTNIIFIKTWIVNDNTAKPGFINHFMRKCVTWLGHFQFPNEVQILEPKEIFHLPY